MIKKPERKPFEGFDFFLSQIKPNLRNITSYSFEYLLNQYQDIMDQAEKHLIQAAREQKQENEKERFIAAIEQCQRLKKSFVSAFGHSMMEALKPLNGHPNEDNQQNHFLNSVRALASHAREDEVFMLNATDRATQFYGAWTKEILGGLQKALPESRLNNDNNPFTPNIIGNAIFSSLKITSMHSSVKKQIFLLFQDLLFKKLDIFYTQVIDHLQRIGIKVKNPNAKIDPNLRVISEDDIPLLEPTVAEIDTIDSAFNELLEQGIIPPDINNEYYVPLEQQYTSNLKKKVKIIPIKDIDQLLANIQKGYDPASDGDLPEYLQSHLIIESSQGEVNVIRTHDENIINLISLIFNQIVETQDKRMADLFIRLKVPYTRIVLKDELFFHDTSHPCRELLDQLLSLTYSSHEQDRLYKQIQMCVTKILLRYNGEISLFTDLIKAVEGYHESNLEPFLESCNAMRDQLELEEKRRLGQTTINVFIKERCKRLSRQLRFHVLLEKLWAQIMVEVLLSEGTESTRWKITVKLLDVILILTDKSDNQHFKSLSDDIPTIISKLSQFLSDNGIDTDRRKIFLNQLQEINTLIAGGKKLAEIDDDDLTHTYDIDMIIDDYDSEMMAEMETARIGSEHKTAKNVKALELTPIEKRPKQSSAEAFVKKLVIGQWMIFIVDNDRCACVLTYYSIHNDSYVFCDRHNKKLFERKSKEIVQDICLGFASPLESTLSFDGILARVVSKLTSKK